jgi:hypothetical protein
MANKDDEKLKGIEALAKRYNTSVHTIARFRELALLSYRADPSVVICAISDTGVGKTFVTEAIAAELDRFLITRRTANEEKEDSVGLPHPTEDHTAYEFLPHKDLLALSKSKKKGMVFIDEFNRGGPAVIKAYFNAIERKQFGDLNLPSDTLFMVAMNPSNSNYSVADVMSDKALKKRFRFFLIQSDAESYLSYVRDPKTPAHEQGHHLVVAFLEAYPQYVYDHDALENGQLFATPYHWSRISRTCRSFDKMSPGWEKDVSGSMMASLIEGDIGSTLTELFEKFIGERYVVIKPTDVLLHFPKVKDKIKAQLDGGHYDTLHELVAALVIHMISSKPEPKKIAENLCDFLGIMHPEIARTFLEKLHRESLKNTEGGQWFGKLNRELVAGGKDGKGYETYRESPRTQGRVSGPGHSFPSVIFLAMSL